MGNSGWTADPAFVLVPPEATDTDPRIFIGGADDDPILAALGQTEGIIFYFGEQRAFVISVEQNGPPGAPADIGRLHIWGYCGFPFQLHQIVNIDYDINLNLVSWDFNPDSPDISMQSVLSLKADIVGVGADTQPLDTDPAEQDAFLFGISMARGVVNTVFTTASSAAIGTTETVVLTLPSFRYRSGRTYQIELRTGNNTVTAGSIANQRMRKTTAAGQDLGEFFRTPLPTANAVTAASGFTYFTVGAADVTAVLVCTLQASAVGNVNQSATAASPRSLIVRDVTETTLFTASPVLV
jgi:hypothetical protein